jgi:hypothetical protein
MNTYGAHCNAEMHLVVCRGRSYVAPALRYAAKVLNSLASVLRHDEGSPCAIDAGDCQ